ncbi:MAG: lantibiotic ABC transporter, partial [Desulfobulbaceae bacterium]
MMASLRDRARKLRDTIEPFGWLSRTGPPSAYAECIAPLLVALRWDGEVHQLCESLPHYPDQIGRIDVINVLSNLNYSIQQARIHLENFDPRISPCLLVIDQD